MNALKKFQTELESVKTQLEVLIYITEKQPEYKAMHVAEIYVDETDKLRRAFIDFIAAAGEKNIGEMQQEPDAETPES